MAVSKKWVETLLCYAAGAVFAIAWWLWIDATVYHGKEDHEVKVLWWHYFAGIITTLGFIGINLVSWNDLNADILWGDNVSGRARVFLFVSFFVAFAGVIMAIWVGVAHWFMREETTNHYGGVMIIVQNILIFASALMYRFAKPPEEEMGF